ncbi:hypothetical protein FRC07_011218 [Ceratobasidium sp. 392]|nr:hypothetical protein FRC07_011218 [Ceratobasidium sp. 392]
MQRSFITRPRPVASTAPVTMMIIDSASEPEINLVDSSDSSDIEIIGIGLSHPTAKPAPPRPASDSGQNNVPAKTEIIDLSMDEFVDKSLSAAISQQVEGDSFSDDESVPEGFELWDPTTPVPMTRTVPAQICKRKEEAQRDLTWHEPKMDWFREDCTGARSAGAYVEPAVRHYGRKTHIEMTEIDYTYISTRATNQRPAWIREKSKHGLPRESISRSQSSILYSDIMVPIPGMNAPRGAVNCISQSRGYIAVGRTYEEDAAYDGGGLALWKVATQKAQDIPAHITHRSPGNNPRLPIQSKQNSILALSFDPAEQLWRINEDENTVDHRPDAQGGQAACRFARKAGSWQLVVQKGKLPELAKALLRLYDTTQSLLPGYQWWSKRSGEAVVSIAWGVNRSQRMIVAGTQDDENIIGRLAIIDAVRGGLVSRVDNESCSTVSVDPSGTVIAFTGSGRDKKPHRHVLRLFDAHRTDWRPVSVIGIPASKSNTPGEVIEAMWSPDGIHLACARDDNSIDVFDTRWLGQRQSMLVFKHDTDASMNTGENTELYGVQGMAWFGSDKLVSGGADHCVRVWDVRKDEESRVLANMGGAVGYLVGSEDPELFPIIAGDFLGNSYYLPNRLLVNRS